ncbi:IML1 [[Candida] subhashii]|uniref:Vacuolar membrane-associated protein IML1 n=1 Tax=[Candida] subhashii TaxID=561895 RepID=A0A8J5QJS9_9ASCO|nr:IML1 [[Candida] subhashii]KAG7662077.1 IML1 [[Candida] subhashii]
MTNSNAPMLNSTNRNRNAYYPTSSRISHRQMTANHASLTIGAAGMSPSGTVSSISSIRPSSHYINRNIGSTITVSRRNNHDLDSASINATRQQSRPKINELNSKVSVQQPNENEIKNPIQVTVWFHDLQTSTEDIIIDSNAFPGGVQVGQVFELQDRLKKKDSKKLIFVVNERNLREQLDESSNETVTDEGATSSGPGPKSKFQISLISNPLQKLLDLPPRSLVQLKKITKIENVVVDLVEIFIKDVNLARHEMWNFSSELVGTCGYIEQRLSYLNSRTGIIKYMYKNGKKLFSGYINQDTKIIFRSESAKLTVLIQLSTEMWNFEENGEIMFHKLVNNLFPEIFRRWRDKNTHHSITIVLFTSVDLTDIPWTSLLQGERPPNRRDYYRVVVDQVSIQYWDRIMANLRLEFANFKRDIMLHQTTDNDDNTLYVMDGTIFPSVKGNILEAINVGLTLLTDRFRNTDLKHSLNHFMLITPGTGLFDVDYDLMLETSKKITSIDSSLDIICLSQPPLHVTPLFRYLVGSDVCHCVPSWCDISFYRDKTEGATQWIPRCKIYELQMMGVMENEVNDARIPRFHIQGKEKALLDVMDDYDEDIFKPISKKNDKKEKENIEFKDMKPKQKQIGEDVVKPTSSTAPLSLLYQRPVIKLSDSSTTVSSAVGTVARPDSETSALSKLYSLNKNTDDVKSLTATSSQSIRSITPMSSTIRTLDSYRKDAQSPRIIKGESLFNRSDPDRLRQSLGPQVGEGDKVSKKKSRSKSSLQKRARSITVIDQELENIANLFWTEISNPSQELRNNSLLRSQISRWSNVFPSKVERKLIKWRSFQAPAALPIATGIFPTPNQLETEYTFQIYNVYLNYENYLELKTTHELMREMIQLRLMLGFQICWGDRVNRAEMERKPAGNIESIIKYFPVHESDSLGARIYMLLDDEIHRIYCDYNGNLNVQLYRKAIKHDENDAKKITLGQKGQKIKPYFPLIRTRYADEYTQAKVDSIAVQPQKYNWNQFDQLLAGFDDAMPEEKKEFHRMKFVVMPTDIPKNAYYINNESLTPEEIRVEGLRKLINVIERGKYKKTASPGRSTQQSLSDIVFYTGNLYDFLKEECNNYDLTGTQPPLMVPEHMRFNKSIKLADLAKELQGPTGLKLVDRTWHFKRHLDCFIGSELVSWLVECFEDIETREEATNYGQHLKDMGLFRHVESRHGLLDGYYFYRFEDEYFDKSNKQSRSLWFGRKRSSTVDGSATPKLSSKSDSESSKSPYVEGLQELTRITSLALDSENSSMVDSRKIKKFVLSRAIKFDVDPLKKSFRPELVTVHYDRIHNPEHCYHIRLQWLNTTTKFIEDTITSWTRLCERHGLKLVETPWRELCSLPMISPFHSFVEVKLILNPWHHEKLISEKILSSNKYYYHLFLLKKLGFLLDNRSTSFFSHEDIDISYSWGKPKFKYAQFIHKTGAYIVELRSNGDFFLAPNNIHVTRMNSSISAMTDYESNSKIINLDSQKVMLQFRDACQNAEFLEEVFMEAKDTWREESFSRIT